MDKSDEVKIGFEYDVTVGYGKDEEFSETHTLRDVARIVGYENPTLPKNHGETIEHRCLNGYELMVSFYNPGGTLVGAFQRSNIRAITLSPGE